MQRTVHIPKDCYDLSRMFISGKESILTLFPLNPLNVISCELDAFPTHCNYLHTYSSFFHLLLALDYFQFQEELQSLSIDDQIGNLYYQCRGEDYWGPASVTEETKIMSLGQKVDCYVRTWSYEHIFFL